jgi:hypothetical protein
MQSLLNVKADQVLVVKESEAGVPYSNENEKIAKSSLFKEITDSLGIHYKHEQQDLIDFNVQKLLPHKFSEYGPALAVGDINGDGLDDIICGGAAYHSAQIFLQQKNGKFVQQPLLSEADAKNKMADDLGILLFDVDGDGDLDLFIAHGGYGNEHNLAVYQDGLYVNNGKGLFTPDSLALPANHTSKFCVRAADFDHDGDLDLFISGRVDPWNYPKAVSSSIYRNDSTPGQIRFTDVTSTVAKDLIDIGMVCDAIWTDFDNDGWPDLILAGEWMPICFLKNDHGVFKNITSSSGISKNTGWWNSIVAGDFDNDGDIDYVVGNLGLNSFYKASEQYPARAYAKDFDKNGIYDMITSLYIPDQFGTMKEFPAETRDDLIRQINALRKKFPTYQSFANADMDKVLTKEERQGALILEANDFSSALLRNDGNGKFTLLPLPVEAQFSVINGMETEDFDGDGNLDILINGNDFGTEVFTGRYDAMNGLLLKGDGKGGFVPLTILQSGIFIPGNGKALVSLKSAAGNYLVAASQNKGPLKIFDLKRSMTSVPLLPGDISATIKYDAGKTARREFYFGNSFLSESGRYLWLNDKVMAVEIVDSKGKKRNLSFK